MNLIARTEDQRRLATEKLQAYVNSARERSGPALQRIMTEVPQDRIVKAATMRFLSVSEDTDIEWSAPGLTSGGITSERIHVNAMGQIADKTGIPMTYVRHLQEARSPWANKLLAQTLTEHMREAVGPTTRFLTRSVGGVTRGLLSDKFRRIDCKPGLNAMVEVAEARGAVIGDAVATDTRVSVRMILPEIHEIAPGEFVVVGLSWDNSDFGKGAQTLRLFVLRLWCWNGAVLETAMREVHLGARLSDEIDYSERTRALDARATVSAIRDTATALLGPARVSQTTALLSAAAAEKVDPKAKIADLRKRLGKGLADQVSEAYNRPDVEDLPPGNTAWRWSNALSWVAGHSDDAETRIDLEREAGAALKPGKSAPTTEAAA